MQLTITVAAINVVLSANFESFPYRLLNLKLNQAHAFGGHTLLRFKFGNISMIHSYFLFKNKHGLLWWYEIDKLKPAELVDVWCAAAQREKNNGSASWRVSLIGTYEVIRELLINRIHSYGFCLCFVLVMVLFLFCYGTYEVFRELLINRIHSYGFWMHGWQHQVTCEK